LVDFLARIDDLVAQPLVASFLVMMRKIFETRCESWWPPPLRRAPQPVSIQTRPVSHRWRALAVSYVYRRVYELLRDSPRPKSRDAVGSFEAPKVSNWPKSLETT
jgi:hypothetical protein